MKVENDWCQVKLFIGTIAPSVNEDAQDILYSEIEAAIQRLKRNKSQGPDGITAEMLQAGGESLARQIHNLCNKAWHGGIISEDWGKSILIPIPRVVSNRRRNKTRRSSIATHLHRISRKNNGPIETEYLQNQCR